MDTYWEFSALLGPEELLRLTRGLSLALASFPVFASKLGRWTDGHLAVQYESPPSSRPLLRIAIAMLRPR